MCVRQKGHCADASGVACCTRALQLAQRTWPQPSKSVSTAAPDMHMLHSGGGLAGAQRGHHALDEGVLPRVLGGRVGTEVGAAMQFFAESPRSFASSKYLHLEYFQIFLSP